MRCILFISLIVGLPGVLLAQQQTTTPAGAASASQLQQLKSEITRTSASLHDSAAKIEESRKKLIEAELAAVAANLMTVDQYLHAEANSIAASDVQTALLHVRWAWNDDGPCTNFVLCWTYIDGAGIQFGDGHVGPFVQIYRDGKSAHSCIQSALDALHGTPSNPGLAVEWVMASQIHNRPVFDWLKSHSDAVISALITLH